MKQKRKDGGAGDGSAGTVALKVSDTEVYTCVAPCLLCLTHSLISAILLRFDCAVPKAKFANAASRLFNYNLFHSDWFNPKSSLVLFLRDI